MSAILDKQEGNSMRANEVDHSNKSIERCIEDPKYSYIYQDDNPWISDTEYYDDAIYDQQIAGLNTNRMREQYMNLGIKEGMNRAYNGSLQIGFEKGYEIGAPVGARVGKVKGIMRQMLEKIRPPSDSSNTTEFVEQLSLLVEFEKELRSNLEKICCSLNRRDLFTPPSESQDMYSGDPSTIVKPTLEALELAEGYVRDFLYEKCRWPLISGFTPRI